MYGENILQGLQCLESCSAIYWSTVEKKMGVKGVDNDGSGAAL